MLEPFYGGHLVCGKKCGSDRRSSRADQHWMEHGYGNGLCYSHPDH